MHDLKQGPKRGKAGRYLSDVGGLGVALTRCITNTAAYCLGLALETNLTGKTVAKWEVKLRASHVNSFRNWQRWQYHLLAVPNPYHKGFRVVVHRLRADATNTTWKRQKLHVLEVESTFCVHPINDSVSYDLIRQGTSTKRILAEIQVIRGTGTAVGMVGMLEHQMDTLSLPSWTEPLTSHPISTEL